MKDTMSLNETGASWAVKKGVGGRLINRVLITWEVRKQTGMEGRVTGRKP